MICLLAVSYTHLWGYKFESGAHNEYVLHFGKVCVRYGIDKEEAMTYAKTNFSSDYPDACLLYTSLSYTTYILQYIIFKSPME